MPRKKESFSSGWEVRGVEGIARDWFEGVCGGFGVGEETNAACGKVQREAGNFESPFLLTCGLSENMPSLGVGGVF